MFSYTIIHNDCALARDSSTPVTQCVFKLKIFVWHENSNDYANFCQRKTQITLYSQDLLITLTLTNSYDSVIIIIMFHFGPKFSKELIK